MLRTLGLFLSDQEKKLSRLVCPPPSSMDGDDNMGFFNYEPNLFLQGFVVVSRGGGGGGGSKGTQAEGVKAIKKTTHSFQCIHSHSV